MPSWGRPPPGRNATLESWGCGGLLSIDGTGGGFDPKATQGAYAANATKAYLASAKIKEWI